MNALVEERSQIGGGSLAALVQGITRLNARHDLDGVLQISCDVVVQSLSITKCAIFLYDSFQCLYRFAAGRGVDANQAEQMLPWAQQIGRKLPSADTLAWVDAPLFASGLTAALKMVQEDREVGLLLFGVNQAEVQSLQNILLVKGLAEVVGSAVANAQVFEALHQEQAKRAMLLQRMITAQEEERLRMARELHDETAQSLSAINVCMESAALFLEERSPSQALLQMKTVKNIVAHMLDEIHRLISDLRPSLLDDMGLIPAISWYAGQRLDPVGINYTISGEKIGVRLPAAVETSLFRIAQEAITNIIRHSKASHVKIQLRRVAQEVLLEIADNGVGMNSTDGASPSEGASASDGAASGGFGLTGIYERVKNFGGHIEIHSRKSSRPPEFCNPPVSCPTCLLPETSRPVNQRAPQSVEPLVEPAPLKTCGTQMMIWIPIPEEEHSA